MSLLAARRSALEGLAPVTVPCETESCDVLFVVWAPAGAPLCLKIRVRRRVLRALDDFLVTGRVGEPARYLHLVLGKEAHPVLACGVQIPVEGVLHPVEREERHRGGDPHIDPEHPCLYRLPPVPYGRPVFGIDGASIAEVRAVCELDGLFERVHTNH